MVGNGGVVSPWSVSFSSLFLIFFALRNFEFPAKIKRGGEGPTGPPNDVVILLPTPNDDAAVVAAAANANATTPGGTPIVVPPPSLQLPPTQP